MRHAPRPARAWRAPAGRRVPGRATLLIVAVAAWLVAAAAPTATPGGSGQACGRTLQSLVDATPGGGSLAVPACVYRETVRIDRPIELDGTPGAEIRGSDVWTDWRRVGDGWVSTLAVPVFAAHGECRPGTVRCLWPEQVFRDDRPLGQVAGAPASGQFSLDPDRHVLLGDDPAGHRIEVTTRSRWIVPLVDGITIAGMTMRHAANDAQTGALDDDGHRLIVRDSRLSDAHGAVVWMSGRGTIVDNEIARGGQLGIGKGGSLVSGNDIHDNNTEDFDPGWEAGGLKAVASDVVVSGNAVHDNNGPGVWFDSGSTDITIDDNRIYRNRRPGIVVEVSSRVRVTANDVWQNGAEAPGWLGGAGILVQTSGDVRIDGNVLAWNADGIGVESQDRPDRPADADHDIEIRDNTIVMQDGPDTMIALGWAADWASPLFAAASNNHGVDNAFGYASGEGSSDRFAWNGPDGRLADFAATPGGEGSRYLDGAAIDAALTAARIPLRPSGSIPSRTVIDGQVAILGLVGLELALLIAVSFVRRRRADTALARFVRLASPILVAAYLAFAIGTRLTDLVPDDAEPLLTPLVIGAGFVAIAAVASGWTPPGRPAAPGAGPGDQAEASDHR